VGNDFPLSLGNGRSPHGHINQRQLSINFGITNSITKLHLVGISTETVKWFNALFLFLMGYTLHCQYVGKVYL
jgi:hypothetical protein